MNFPLARVAKLAAHARFLKSTILIKIGDMFVKWILKGRKCDKTLKVLSRLAVLSVLSGEGFVLFFNHKKKFGYKCVCDHPHTHTHIPSIAFQHLPPNTARFSYATEGALFISAQLSTDVDSAL